MNIQSPSTLRVFQSFSHNWKSFFFQSCPTEFIRFLCECIVNLLNGNLQRTKRHHVTIFRNVVRLPSLETLTWKQRREVLASEKLQIITVTTPMSSTICLDMKQFVLVPASVYNKSLNTQLVTKQEIPKYQPIDKFLLILSFFIDIPSFRVFRFFDGNSFSQQSRKYHHWKEPFNTFSTIYNMPYLLKHFSLTY